MAEHQTKEEQARREDELAEFFASRPEVSNRGFTAKVRLTKAVLPLVALALLAANGRSSTAFEQAPASVRTGSLHWQPSTAPDCRPPWVSISAFSRTR